MRADPTRYAYHLGQQTSINLPSSAFPNGTCGLPLAYKMIPAVLCTPPRVIRTHRNRSLGAREVFTVVNPYMANMS